MYSIVKYICDKMSEDRTIQTAIQIKEKFYEDTRKNQLLNKNKQKFQCGEAIQQQISFESLMQKTFWIVPTTNKVYFDYTIFKLYAIPENYNTIVDRVLTFCAQCANEFHYFEVHVNIDTFTVSAAQRYKDIIILFCRECLMRDTRFIERLSGMYIYNTPNMIEHISAILMPLIPPEVRPKIQLYNKKESAEQLRDHLKIINAKRI